MLREGRRGCGDGDVMTGARRSALKARRPAVAARATRTCAARGAPVLSGAGLPRRAGAVTLVIAADAPRTLARPGGTRRSPPGGAVATPGPVGVHRGAGRTAIIRRSGSATIGPTPELARAS